MFSFFVHRPKRNPLFHVDLLMDNQGVHYSTNLNSFESILVQLFDKGILSTQNVPQLEKVEFCGQVSVTLYSER